MNQQHKICCTYQCIYNIDSRLDCQEKRVRFQCWWRGQRAKTLKTGDRQVRPDNEPRNYVAWLTATPGCTRYLIWDLCASCRNGDIAEIFYRPRQHLLLEVRSCGSCLGQLWGGDKSREPRSILTVDGFSIRSNSFTEKLKRPHTHKWKLFTSFAQTYVRASFAQAQNSSILSSLNHLKTKSKTCFPPASMGELYVDVKLSRRVGIFAVGLDDWGKEPRCSGWTGCLEKFFSHSSSAHD